MERLGDVPGAGEELKLVQALQALCDKTARFEVRMRALEVLRECFNELTAIEIFELGCHGN
jgi:hypothetical protein